MTSLKSNCIVITILIFIIPGSPLIGAKYQLLVEDAALQPNSTNIFKQSQQNNLTYVRRSNIVELNPVLTSGMDLMIGDTVILNLFSDTRYVAHIDNVSININQTVTMSGFVESFPYSDVFVCRTGNRVLVNIYIPDTNQRFIIGNEPRLGIYKLLELDASRLMLLEDGPALLSYVENYANETIPDQNLPDIGPLDPANIDVMIVYTLAAYEYAEFSWSGIDNYIAYVISEANRVLSRSQTNATLTLVHSAMVDYVEDVEPLEVGSISLGSTELIMEDLWYGDDGKMDEVHDWRNQYGADLVSLLVSGDVFTGDKYIAGRGYLMLVESGSPAFAFSLVVLRMQLPPYTFIHEIGHNMGCGHSKYDPDNKGLFSYSHGWRWDTYCSVMSYTHGTYQRVGIFSNPDVLDHGLPSGDPNEADNARTIRETKHIIAEYRKPGDVNTFIHIPVRIYIDVNAPKGGDGQSWVTAFQSLRDALIYAQNGDEIWVAAGTYKPTEDTERTKSFLLRTGVSIYGGFAGHETELDQRDWITNRTILSGDIGDPGNNQDNSYQVVVGGDNIIVNGFTIVDGYADFNSSISGSGGGIYFPKSDKITVANCTFENNYALVSGGAIHISSSGSDSTIMNCTFNNNQATYGGGAISILNEYSTIKNCIFNNNQATLFRDRPGTGGGILAKSGELKIIDCIFKNNGANGAGGGINWGGELSTVTGSVFLGNSAEDGGGIYYRGGNSIIANCLFVANRAAKFGGCISGRGNNLTVNNCTFTANQAPDGVSLNDGSSGEFNVSNCIIWEEDNWKSDISIPNVAYSNIKGGYQGEGNIDTDPLFGKLGYWDQNGTSDDTSDDFWVDGDYHLKSEIGRWDPVSESWVIDDVTSPCIDTGDPNSPIGEEPEPNGGRINMGAYGGISEASKSP